MKNEDRVHAKRDSKRGGAQAQRQTTTQAGSGLKTYRVFTAKAGETDMTKWQEGECIQARSPLAAARQQLGQFKRLAVCRFNQGDKDFIFDLVRDTPVAPAVAGAGDSTPPAQPELLWPAKTAEELLAALCELNAAADAAVALAVMNGHITRHAVKDSAVPEDFDLPRFGAGAAELARMTATRLNITLGRWKDCLDRLVAEVKGHRTPVRALPDCETTWSRAIELDGTRACHETECAIGALKHCIQGQGWVMVALAYEGVAPCEFAVLERLDAVWEAAWKASVRLGNAVLAVRAQQAGAEERKAA